MRNGQVLIRQTPQIRHKLGKVVGRDAEPKFLIIRRERKDEAQTAPQTKSEKLSFS